MSPTRTEIVTNLRSVFTTFGALVDGLSADQWQAQSLCPAWTVHGVVAHVTAIETALCGWRPGDSNPLAAMGDIVAALNALAPDELAARYHAVTADRMAELDAMTDDDFAEASMTPVGPGTYGRFMAIREFDMWVHERDISVPLGIVGNDGGAAAEMALDEVQGSIGFIVGKKIGLTEGQGIAFVLTGPVERRILVKVTGRATRVEELADPDVTLTTDSLTFMLLACGRIDPQQPIDDGRVTWSGESEIGERAARNLAFTM